VIISRTPYRCSLFGGGSDYPRWYKEHGGMVLTSTIDRYCYLSVRYMKAFLGYKYNACWSKMERVNSLEEIEHSGVRGCLQYMGVDEGFEINHAGDLPARSGLGSSSAFTVGMLHALHALQGRHVSKDRLAREAIEVEQVVLKETVGIQDQIECAHGGLNLIEIHRDGEYTLRPVIIHPALKSALEGKLMLFFTGLQRNSSQIADAQVSNIERKEYELKAIQNLVPRALEAITNGVLEDVGNLLHETWMLKRELSDKVSNKEIDGLYTAAREAGAIGGKLLGAGGGGFFLFYVPEDRHDSVREAMGGLHDIQFKIENGGSQIVLS
jgi:D-glycero-alpha-D-manno-heptose-7-phosphate kinase